MGKKSKPNSNLGRSLIKDRFGVTKGRKLVENNTMLHTTEIQDGYDWGRLNLQSVTEESSFQEFLSTAELAGTEFQGEKLNISFVNPRSNIGLLSADERKKMKAEHEQNKEFIKIPRRPPWTSETTPEELDLLEREHFLIWRRDLASLQEDQGLLLTPFEKNLQFWRQLWRVVERSDVIIQIVDGRNPLLFRCEDLEKYVKEVSKDKINVILINKADFLTEEQRQIWADYFTEQGIKVAFFSALITSEEEQEEEDEQEEKDESSEEEEEYSEEFKNIQKELKQLESVVERSADKLTQLEKEIGRTVEKILVESHETKDELVRNLSPKTNENPSTLVTENLKQLSIDNPPIRFQLSHEIITNQSQNSITPKVPDIPLNSKTKSEINNSPALLSKDELIHLFKSLHFGPKVTKNITTVGLVGYPNVGKSSTINSLLLSKKVSVSATPGKTKHFQTIFLDKDLLLCDCPGLVMPSFVLTKAEMVVSGILPIDQMRDHVPPVNLVTSLIPKHVLEDRYGVMLPLPADGEDPTRAPTAEELCNAYGYIRGFMTANGQPDNPRSARYILKDYVNGKLLFCHAPPGMSQDIYHTYPEKTRLDRILPEREIRAIKVNKVTGDDLDKAFFMPNSKGVHARGVPGKSAGLPSNTEENEQAADKPWKKANKHANKKRREKLRRVYAHLDQH